jgi:ribonuclease BN (tRNA processing enzyme)
MELYFPGSARVDRRFPINVVELEPGTSSALAGLEVTVVEVDHPCGAPPLAVRLNLGGKIIGYTGDTAWSPVLPAVAAGADLFIAEAYYFDKAVPYHLRHADLVAHHNELTSHRIVLTHPSADMLACRGQSAFELAHDGLTIEL